VTGVTCSAAILAGGHATRFGGRDKSALIVEGRTILERQIEALAPLTGIPGDIMIVGSTAHPSVPGTRAIADRVPDSGPLGGLHAALSDAQHGTVILLACDMPFVTAAFLAHLVGLAAEDVDAVVPQTERGYHPLCAVYRRTAVDRAARRLDERRLRMIDLLADVRVRVVPSGEIDQFGDRHRLLANVNTAADFANINSEGARPPDALQGHELKS